MTVISEIFLHNFLIYLAVFLYVEESAARVKGFCVFGPLNCHFWLYFFIWICLFLLWNFHSLNQLWYFHISLTFICFLQWFLKWAIHRQFGKSLVHWGVISIRTQLIILHMLIYLLGTFCQGLRLKFVILYIIKY